MDFTQYDFADSSTFGRHFKFVGLRTVITVLSEEVVLTANAFTLNQTPTVISEFL